MDGLDWLLVLGVTFLFLFFTWWVLDVVLRFVFRRVDRKSGSLALDQPEDARDDPVT